MKILFCMVDGKIRKQEFKEDARPENWFDSPDKCKPKKRAVKKKAK